MKMYVANCTNQVQQFAYRIPGVASPRMQLIAIGGQVRLSGDLTIDEVDAIVEQHSFYGMYDATKVAQTHEHIHLLYSLNKEIAVSQMRQALERNLVLMGQKGEQFRKEAAVAVHNTAQENDPGFRGVNLAITELTKNGDDPVIDQEIIVRRPGDSRTPPATRAQRRAAKRAA